MPPLKSKTRRKTSSSRQPVTRTSRPASATAEKTLAAHLRADRLGGFHFERRCRIEGHVFPLFCRAAKLAIEIDRATRDGPSRRDYRFDAYLRTQGIRVEHFDEGEIRRAPDRIASQILSTCRNRTDAPPAAAISPATQPRSLRSPAHIAPKASRRLAWLALIASAAILIALIFPQMFDVSRSIQGIEVAQKLLAPLMPAPTRTAPGPSPTLVEATFPTRSAERYAALASNPIFTQAENNLESQPQSVIDLLLPQLSQFTAKSDLEDAYSYLGRAELKLKHYRAAAGYFKQLYALEPSIELLHTLAIAYDLDGDWQNALTAYRGLAEWNGNNAAVYRALAQPRIKELERKLGTPAP